MRFHGSNHFFITLYNDMIFQNLVARALNLLLNFNKNGVENTNLLCLLPNFWLSPLKSQQWILYPTDYGRRVDTQK